MPQLGRQILNVLPDLDHNSTPHAPPDDVTGRLDDFGESDLTRHVRKLVPIEPALQLLPGHLSVQLSDA